MTFEELVAKSLDHAGNAEAALAVEEGKLARAAERGGEANVAATSRALAQLREVAGIHATLAEAYARLASAVVVNRTSLHVIAEGQALHSAGPRRES